MLMPGRGTDSISSISNVLGNILVLYTDFSDNTFQGWQSGNGTSIENQRMRVDVQGPWYGTIRDMVLTAGKQYRARITYDASTMITAGPAYFNAINGNNGSNLAVTGMYSGGTYELNFTAPSAIFVRFAITTPNTTPTGINVKYYIDNFILEEVKPQPEVPPVVSGGCITMTQTKWVTTWVDSCYYVSDWTWPNYDYSKPTGGATTGSVKVVGSDIVADVKTGEIVSFGFNCVPNISQSLTLEISNLVSGTPTIGILEEQNGNWTVLASKLVGTKGTYTLNFVPSKPEFKVVIPGPFQAAMRRICVKKPVLKQEHVLVDICPGDRDRYRFGFNGQEKVNEWAGRGNHNTAKFWEYDTRTGQRLNTDPVVKPWESTYSTLGRTPIWKIDPDGNTDYFNQSGKIIYRDQTTVGDGRVIVVTNDEVAEQIKAQKSITMLKPEMQRELPSYAQRQEIKAVIYSFGRNKNKPPRDFEVGGRGVKTVDAKGSLQVEHVRAENGKSGSGGQGSRSINPYNSTYDGVNPNGKKYQAIEDARVSGGYSDYLAYVWHYHPESNSVMTYGVKASEWDIDEARDVNEFVISGTDGNVYFYGSSSSKENYYDRNGNNTGLKQGASGSFDERKFYNVKEGQDEIK